MVNKGKREANILRVTTDSDGVAATPALRFMVGDQELGEVISFKLGREGDDGRLRGGDIVQATLEVAVKLG